ncbi:hypothetical protein [Caudoviricetes sp.]|nr:hypothetical protein [Caudoviricetes sp.]
MIISALSPVSKIFIPEFHEALMRDPSLIKQTVELMPFKVKIQCSCSAYIFEAGKQKDIQETHLAWWLTGGSEGKENQETDWTGLVEIKMPTTDISELLSYAIKGEKIPQKLAESTMEATIEAEQRSKKRVMQNVERVYRHMQAQYAFNKEAGKDDAYMPTTVEYLCGYILADELEKNQQAKKALTSKFQELMKNIQV